MEYINDALIARVAGDLKIKPDQVKTGDYDPFN